MSSHTSFEETDDRGGLDPCLSDLVSYATRQRMMKQNKIDMKTERTKIKK
jgi:hypothetical protein